MGTEQWSLHDNGLICCCCNCGDHSLLNPRGHIREGIALFHRDNGNTGTVSGENVCFLA